MEDKERKLRQEHITSAEHFTPLAFGEGKGGEAVGSQASSAEHFTPLSFGEGQGGEAVGSQASSAEHFTPLSFGEGQGGEAVGSQASSAEHFTPLSLGEGHGGEAAGNQASPTKSGFYGPFGGAYVPEILYKCVHDLQDAYLPIIESEEFKQEFRTLLRDYAGRPSPLYYAKRMSERYGCQLYLKREDLNHTGAHKINNAIGQILLARKMGKTRIIAETGAGQHGVATATVCALFGMECEIFMGKTDVERQHPNVERMRMLGAKVHPVTTGNMTLSDACSEAIRDWCCHPEDTFYLVGSTMGPHPYPDIVAKMQSVISEEIKWQLKEKIGRDYPDYLIACVGGGSNAAGTIYHYVDDDRVKIVLAEAGGHGIDTDYTAATMHCGTEGIIHGARTLVMQTDDGQIKEAFTISAGLDYPGIGPMHAYLAQQGREKVLAINDDEAIYAGYELTRTEGIIPAIESAHAVAALRKLSFKPSDVVVLTVSGRGDKDMNTYLTHKDMAKEYGKF